MNDTDNVKLRIEGFLTVTLGRNLGISVVQSYPWCGKL